MTWRHVLDKIVSQWSPVKATLHQKIKTANICLDTNFHYREMSPKFIQGCHFMPSRLNYDTHNDVTIEIAFTNFHQSYISLQNNAPLPYWHMQWYDIDPSVADMRLRDDCEIGFIFLGQNLIHCPHFMYSRRLNTVH